MTLILTMMTLVERSDEIGNDYDEADAHTELIPDLIDRSASDSVNDNDNDMSLSDLIDRPDEVDDDYKFI